MDRLIKIGKVKPITSSENDDMTFGIGLEKLDRDIFDPRQTYDKIAALGVKRVRLQSGWMKTEQKRGVYDFKWLDDIVDNLLKRNLKPWLCVCYGNPLYTEMAKEVFGAVGCPPVKTETERVAWYNYCKALAKHYKGRISEFEIWNEPDGTYCWRTGENGTEYGNMVIDSAKAIRSEIKDAKIFAGSFACRAKLDWFIASFETGMGDYIDAFTYHDYCEKETRVQHTVETYRCLIDRYNPKIKLIQGEVGAPSSSRGHGALNEGHWTEERQAKMLARRIIVELTNNLEFISWFTTVDMVEALNGLNQDKASYLDYGYFGVLSADFDENGKSVGTYHPKKSYYTLQNVVSIFRNVEQSLVPVMIHWDDYSRYIYALTDEWEDLMTASFKKANGSMAYVYWKPTNILTTSYESVATFFVVYPIDKVHLVDPVDGAVYKIPESMIEDRGNGVYKIHLIPVKDSPLILTLGDFCEVIHEK